MRTVPFISAVILFSPRPSILADFYRREFGIPLESDQHVDQHVPPHFECQLGDIHFAIHPLSNNQGEVFKPTQSMKIALAVSDLDATLSILRSHGVEPLYPPIDRGFARITGIRDPDDNLVELTQLSESWLLHLESRSKVDRDVVFSMRSFL